MMRIVCVATVVVSVCLGDAQAVTIDRMTTESYPFVDTYDPGGSFDIVGNNDVYYVSDGTTWNSGAGVFTS